MAPDQAARLVAIIVAAFPDWRAPVETVQLYTAFLSDADAELAARAVTRWCMRQLRAPRIAELRDAIEREAGAAPPDLDRAWAEVQAEIHRVGHVGVPRFTHVAVQAAVEAIGWRALCESTEPGVERAHFQRAYDSTRRRTADSASHQLIEGIMPLVRELMNNGPLPLNGVAAPKLPGKGRR